MKPTTADELILQIDESLFRKQRQLLDDISSAAAIPIDVRLSPVQVELLEGLQNLLDNLADVAHDQFGADCLLEQAGVDPLSGR